MSAVPRRLLIVAVATLALALASRALPVARSRALPTRGAQWIWKDMHWDDHAPAAFCAVRDFELASPPARARLLVAADPEYVLTLNGRPVGAGVYAPGAPLDVYEVGPLLLPGGNRLVAELRSPRGEGGFLAALVDENGRLLAGTDGSWRIVAADAFGLERGWLPLSRAAAGDGAAHVWGYPPLGRWGRPRAGDPKPLLPAPAGPSEPAVSAAPLPLAVGPAELARRPGAPVLYDWGREVAGYLTVEVPPGDGTGAALLFTGTAAPPDPLRSNPAGAILIQPGRRRWLEARPRRFRYAVIVGLVRHPRVAVLPLAAVPAESPAAPGPVRGILGIAAPPLRTPVEDEVWSKLQSVAGVAGRKEL